MAPQTLIFCGGSSLITFCCLVCYILILSLNTEYLNVVQFKDLFSGVEMYLSVSSLLLFFH